MSDNRDATAFRIILEALVAVALVGTFFVYGYSGNTIYSKPAIASGPATIPAAEPAELAKLAPAR